MAAASAGVLPPVDTWDPQVVDWVHGAWGLAEARGQSRISLSDLVKALWAAGDPWSRAYRHLFAGAAAPPPRPRLVPENDIFYAAEPDLVELMESARALGAGRVTPWAVLNLIALRTRGSARSDAPGAEGVWRAPVVALREGGRVTVHRGVTTDDAVQHAAGRQLVAIVVEEAISSSHQRFATPYVEGHFHGLAGDTYVLREPTDAAPFWVLEGVVPDAWAHLAAALRETRRMVPGFLPWLPLTPHLSAASLPLLHEVLDALRPLPDALLGTDPSQPTFSEGSADGPGIDPLVVALDALAGESAEIEVAPVLRDRPGHEDALGHQDLALALAASLALQETAPPLAIALLGPTGSGRSDLLQRLGHAWGAGLADLPERTLRRCVAARTWVHLDARTVSDPDDALASAVQLALGVSPHKRPVQPTATVESPPLPSSTQRATQLLLPLAGRPEGATGRAKTLAVSGLTLASLGAAGVLATPGSWIGLLPAALAGLGAVLAAAGLGEGVVRVDQEHAVLAPEPAPPRPAEPSPSERLAALAPDAPRVLITLDELDRVPPDAARRLLEALHRLLLDVAPGRAPEVVVALAASAQTLRDATTPDLPLPTLVQVPVWLNPVGDRAFRAALTAWTGLEAPKATVRPVLTAVNTPAQRPPPVPIRIEAEEAGLVNAADLRWLVAFRDLCPATARSVKRLVNQARLARAATATSLGARELALWLTLAEGHPTLASALAHTLDRQTDRATLDSMLAAVRDQDPGGADTLKSALAALSDDERPTPHDLLQAAPLVLRWTFAGPTWRSDPSLRDALRRAS